MSAPAPVQLPPPRAWPMARAMVGVGLACGVLIVVVVEFTRPVIARNRAEALRRAIFQVLPKARTSTSFRRDREGGFVPESDAGGDAGLVHAGYDEDGQLVGVAIEAAGMGYQDVIRVLYGIGFEAQAIIGLRVLESRETPGLGDRIETDPDFVANFERLDVSLLPDGSAVAHPIEAVKHGQKQHPWQVDGITGATVSSVAIASILRASSVARVPELWDRRADFEDPLEQGEVVR